MNDCIVIIKDVEEAIKLSDIIIKNSPKHGAYWTKNFWEKTFKERQDWAINISYNHNSDTIKNASYCDIPWYQKTTPYCNFAFMTLQEFIDSRKPKKPFIRKITIEDIYKSIKTEPNT